MYYTDSYNFTTRVIVVLIIKIEMCDLKIFENNKIKYSWSWSLPNLGQSMGIIQDN